MTKEEFKEQFIEYAEYNLDDETTLIAIKEILNRISNSLYENGYIKESNSLTTCELTINDVLESGKVD